MYKQNFYGNALVMERAQPTERKRACACVCVWWVTGRGAVCALPPCCWVRGKGGGRGENKTLWDRGKQRPLASSRAPLYFLREGERASERKRRCVVHHFCGPFLTSFEEHEMRIVMFG